MLRIAANLTTRPNPTLVLLNFAHCIYKACSLRVQSYRGVLLANMNRVESCRYHRSVVEPISHEFDYPHLAQEPVSQPLTRESTMPTTKCFVWDNLLGVEENMRVRQLRFHRLLERHSPTLDQCSHVIRVVPNISCSCIDYTTLQIYALFTM